MQKGASLFVLLSSALLYWVGFSMVRPMLALYFGDAGYSAVAIGILMATHAFIPVLFAMPIGSLIDRIGSRRSVLAGSLMLMLSGGLYWMGGSSSLLFPIMLGQVVSGLGSLLSWGALQAAAAHEARKLSQRSKGDHLLANFAFVNSLAQFGGPMLGGVIADWSGFEAVFLIYTAMAFISVCFAFLIPKLVRPAGEVRDIQFNLAKSYGSGIQLLKDNKPFSFALFINGILFILIDIKGTFFPIYLAGNGFTNTQVGFMLSVGGVASIIIRPFTGYMIRWLGHQNVMLGSMVLGAACLIALVFEPATWLLAVIVFAWGVCAGINQPMALIIVAQTVQSEQQGMGMSLRTMANRIVQMINPIAFGALSGLVGVTLGFGAVGVMLLGVAAYTRRLYRRGDGSLRSSG